MHFFTRLSKFFQKEGVTHRVASPREEQALEQLRQQHPHEENQAIIADRPSLVYPPVDPGMPVADIQELLDAQKDLTTRIRTHSAMEGDRYTLRFGGPIARMANYIGALPGTSNGLYAGPGGLLKACVEMSLYAFQASHGRIFTGHLGVEQRFLLEVRWQYVCFAAGLIWPIGKTIDQVQVTSDSGVTWPARVKPLLDWASQTGSHHLHCNWPEEDLRPGPSATGASVIGVVLGEENLQWLEEGSPAMVTALMGIVSGHREAKYGIAFDLVNDMWRRVCQAEEARNPQTYGRAMYGQHMGPHILDCIAVLISSGVWRLNLSPLIVNESGVYLIWPDAGESIIKIAKELGKKGFPSTAAGLLSTIESAKLIYVDSNVGPLIDISDEYGEIKSSIKMAKPMSVVSDYDPGNYMAPKNPNKEAETNTPKAKFDSERIKVEGDDRTTSRDEVVNEGIPLNPPDAGEDPFIKIEELQRSDVLGNSVEGNNMPAVGVVSQSITKKAESAQDCNQESGVVSEDNALSNVNQDRNQEGNNGKRDIAEIKTVAPKIEDDIKEIKYSDLLPKDLRSTLNNMTAETLGKLVMLWREQGPNDQMRTVEKGIAISVVSLRGLVHDVPSFIDNMAQQGYIDINPLTPGKKIQEVAIPEGGKRKVSCFVISRGLAQKLGL
jgi:hypothetical protein